MDNDKKTVGRGTSEFTLGETAQTSPSGKQRSKNRESSLWECQLEQYKKMPIFIVSPRYTESGEIKEYIKYPFCKDCIYANVESGHLVLYILSYQKRHKFYERRCKFSDIDSGKPVDGVYIFFNEGKAVDKMYELNDSLKGE